MISPSSVAFIQRLATKSLLVSALIFSVLSSYSQIRPGLNAQWYTGSFGDDLGMRSFVTKDLDKNGRADIIMTGTVNSEAFYPWAIFSIIEFDPSTGDYKTKYISRTYFAEILSLEVMDLDEDGVYEIYVGFVNGEIKVIDPLTYQEITSFHTRTFKNSFSQNFGVTSMAKGDIDNNGSTNLIAVDGDTTYVFSESLALIKKIAVHNGGTVMLANVDQDAAIETIYARGYVMEFSETSSKIEFRFFPIANGKIRIADMNNDGINDVLYSSLDTVHVCDINAKKRIRSIPRQGFGEEIGDFQLYDYTNDGIPDVFIGGDHFGGLLVRNGLTAALEFTLNDPSENGITALQIADVDNTPGLELVWTSGANCTCDDHIFVYDLNTKKENWQSRFLTNDFGAFDFGKIPGKLNDQLIVGTYGYYQSYTSYPFMTQFDLQSKKITFDKGLSQYPSVANVSSVRIADIDNDGKNEVLLGTYYDLPQTTVYVFDENFNYLREFSIDGMNFIADINVGDIDGDHENEVIVTAGTDIGSATDSESYHNHIYVFDGKTGTVEWKSNKLAGLNSRIANVMVVNIDDDPALEVLALLYKTYNTNSSLYIIDGLSHELKTYTDKTLNAFTLDDFDHDGATDIIGGTDTGDILVIDAKSLSVKKTLGGKFGQINALQTIDYNGDHVSEYVFSTNYFLEVFNPETGNVVAKTDTLSNATGIYNSIRVSGSTLEDLQIFVNGNHALYSFTIGDVQNIPPRDFVLVSPANNAKLPVTSKSISFSWQPSFNADFDAIRYQIHIHGAGLDSIVSNIDQTQILFNTALFNAGKTYTWSVSATDGFATTTSASFTFEVQEKITTGVSEISQTATLFYPNPFNDYVVIRNNSALPVDRIVITDVCGSEKINASVILLPDSEITLEQNMGNLPSGLYLCRLFSNGTSAQTVRIYKN